MLVYQRVYIYMYCIYIYIYSDIPFGILSGILFGILSDIYYDIINLAFSLTYILTFYIMENMETTGFKRFSQVLTLGSTRSIGQIPLISTAVFLLEKNTMDFPQNDQSQSQMDFVLGFSFCFWKTKTGFPKIARSLPQKLPVLMAIFMGKKHEEKNRRTIDGKIRN